jgi:hypothetical protein
VEKLTVEKLFAVGLSRLEALLHATAEEIAVVSGIREDVAARIVERLRVYRGAHATISAPDPAQAIRELRELAAELIQQHQGFEQAARGWTDQHRVEKRTRRREREQAFLRVKVALARLGERERIARMERLPYQDRIGELERYLEQMARGQGMQPATARRPKGQPESTKN